MTIPTQFVPLNYDVFAGLDVDKKSMAVFFTDHQQALFTLNKTWTESKNQRAFSLAVPSNAGSPAAQRRWGASG